MLTDWSGCCIVIGIGIDGSIVIAQGAGAVMAG